MKDEIQLVIPMSGIGKRFIQAGYADPKPLIEVDGKPMIEHVINLFPGIEDIIFICNEMHLKETNMLKVIRSICPSAKVISVSNEDRRGPVFAVSKAYEYIDDKKQVIVSYCDYGTSWNFDDFLSDIKRRELDGSIACYTGFHPHMLGNDNYAFCKHIDNYLVEIKEKEPFTKNKMDEYASNGTYYFKNGSIMKHHFDLLMQNNIKINGEFYVSLSFNSMVNSGLKVGIYEIEKMLQWGTPNDLETYKSWSSYFKNKKNKNRSNSKTEEATLVLPMAGKGERFEREGYALPKPLITVDDEPMIISAVKSLPRTNKKVFIALKEHIDRYSLNSIIHANFENAEVYGIDNVTKGQACTSEIGIINSKINKDSPILISACDNGVLYDESKYNELVEDKNVDVIVWSFRNNPTSKNKPDMYSWLSVDENDFVEFVSCKKFIFDDPLKTHAIIGTMYFRKASYFLDALEINYKMNLTTNGEFYVDDVINQCISMGLKVKVFESQNYICWGTPDDYKTYNYWKNYFEYKL